MSSITNDDGAVLALGQRDPGRSGAVRLPARGAGLPARPAWRCRLVCGLVVGVVGVSLLLSASRAIAAAAPVAPEGNASRPVASPAEDQPSAEISFALPTRFALITEGGRDRQRLVGVGDALLDPGDPSHLVTLQQIEPQRIRLRDSRMARDIWVGLGARVPGSPDRRYTKTVVLQGVEYQYVATEAPRDPEARLVRLQDERAVLVVEVPPPPPRGRASAVAALATVRITETAPHTYALSRAELQAALNQGARQLAQEGPEFVPQLSLHGGVSLQISTPFAAGRLSGRGFEVNNPKLAAQAGIEVGDVILAINGQAVGSPGDIYTLYRQAQRTPLTDMEVRLERRGVPITKVYRLR